MPLKNHKGFSLVEVMIVVAVMGGLSLVIMNLNKQAVTTQKKFQTDIDADFIMKEIAGILAAPETCSSHSAGVGLGGIPVNSTTTAITAIKNKYPTSWSPGGAAGFGTSNIVIDSYQLSNAGLAPLTETALIINFGTPKVLSTTRRIIQPRKIKLLITVLAGNIDTCRSAWTNQNDYWVKTDPAVVSGDNIFYGSGTVGIGTSAPNIASKLDVVGAIYLNGANGIWQDVPHQNLAAGDTTFPINVTPSGTTVGQGNTVFGINALANNTNGTWNTAIGFGALKNNTFGGGNLAVGYLSMQGNISGGSNIAVGNTALRLNSTGSYNVALGNSALDSNSSGTYNTGIGVNALNKNTTGNNNLGIGFSALYTNSSGDNNVSVGQSSLQFSNASDNTAVGFQALMNSTTGYSNVAIGSQSLLANTSGYYNTAIGSGALASNTNASGNVATGTEALFSTTTGKNNVGTGVKALYSNTTGGNNIAIGNNALFANTTGNGNIAAGLGALTANTTGVDNIGIGYRAINASTTGDFNIVIGFDALSKSTTASSNVVVGHNGLLNNTSGTGNVALGAFALSGNVTGNNNIAIGYNSGTFINSGSSNVIIGSNGGGMLVGSSNNIILSDGDGNMRMRINKDGKIGIGITAADPTNMLTIIANGTVAQPQILIQDPNNSARGLSFGYEQINGASTFAFLQTTPDGVGSYPPLGMQMNGGNVGIGTASPSRKLDVVGSFRASTTIHAGTDITADGTIGASSDKRLKKDITPLSMSLEKILAIRGVSFAWINPASPKGRHIGVIAQEVEKEYPELVLTDAKGMKSVAYMNLVAPLIEAIREQQVQIEALKEALCESNPLLKLCKTRKK